MMHRRKIGVGLLVLAAMCASAGAAEQSSGGAEVWKDVSQPVDVRVKDLVSKLTLEEKASQVLANPPGIERLGIPAYSHRNECLHGVANGVATVFPQAIGMAATWDVALIHAEADSISTEGWAKHNDYVNNHQGNTGEHNGLNFYSPNINIFRDPRWGRGQETFGEDPYLTGAMGVAFITGVQGDWNGDGATRAKAIACAKHFAVHSGPEAERHHFDAHPSKRDLYDTYLPAFEMAIRDAHAGSVMGAYSSLDGIPCCADSWLLTDLLRKQWGFDGMVFSDGGAIGDIWAEHHFVPGPIEAAAAAVKAGCDSSSGGMGQKPDLHATQNGHVNNGIKGGWGFVALPEAVKQGLISEEQVNVAVTRELTMRFRLGLFDPPANVKWSKLTIADSDTAEHRELARKVAEESIVLLKNSASATAAPMLPLDRAKVKRIAVIGPNGDSERMQNGNYAGRPSKTVTIFEGIKAAVGDGAAVTFAEGCPLALRADGSNKPTDEMTNEEVDAANNADVVIFVSGIDASLEKEEGGAREPATEGFHRGDRTKIELPAVQENLLKQVVATGKPVVLVNCSGCAMAIPWAEENVPAIVQAWYPGEEGGTAVARVLFGDVNPGGRLPVTFYASTKDLPKFDDYSMENRTYRYFAGKALYAFGYGLSYTKFEYADAKADVGQSIKVSVTTKNSGQRDGDEVAQVYFMSPNLSADGRRLALCGFKRVHLAAGASVPVEIEVPLQRLRHWDESKSKYVVEPGTYELRIGGASDDAQATVKVAVKEGA